MIYRSNNPECGAPQGIQKCHLYQGSSKNAWRGRERWIKYRRTNPSKGAWQWFGQCLLPCRTTTRGGSEHGMQLRRAKPRSSDES